MEAGRDNRENGEAAAWDAAGALLLRLLQKVTRRPAAPPAGDELPLDSLPPPGQRSGRGAQSLAPYLDQFRNSRPGPLE